MAWGARRRHTVPWVSNASVTVADYTAPDTGHLLAAGYSRPSGAVGNGLTAECIKKEFDSMNRLFQRILALPAVRTAALAAAAATLVAAGDSAAGAPSACRCCAGGVIRKPRGGRRRRPYPRREHGGYAPGHYRREYAAGAGWHNNGFPAARRQKLRHLHRKARLPAGRTVLAAGQHRTMGRRTTTHAWPMIEFRRRHWNIGMYTAFRCTGGW